MKTLVLVMMRKVIIQLILTSHKLEKRRRANF